MILQVFRVLFQLWIRSFAKALKRGRGILSSSKGLSLIEMLVVISIIAFIFSIIGRSISQNRKKASVTQAKILIGVINSAIEEFSYDCGYYPYQLQDLVEQPSDSVCDEWGPEPYLKNGKVPEDPWKQKFRYEYDENNDTYVILSYGADRSPGGTNRFTKDISSDDL